MGTPDFIQYSCLNCGNFQVAQTKLFANNMNVYKPGQFIPTCSRVYANCILETKDKCEQCGNVPYILILNRTYIGVVVFNPTIREFAFGKSKKVK